MNTFYPIDYYKSIKKQRIIYRMSLGVVWAYLVCYFNGLALLAMIFAIPGELFSNKSINASHYPILLLLPTIIYLLFIIPNLILLNKTISAVGIDPESNRTDMITVLKEYYKLNNVENINDKITIDVRLHRAYRSGRVVTCLFDQNTIYLNITILNVYDTFSPFNCLFLYYKCKRIVKRFQKLQSGK